VGASPDPGRGRDDRVDCWAAVSSPSSKNDKSSLLAGILEVPKYDCRPPPSRDCNFSVIVPPAAAGGRRRACGRRTWDPVESPLTLVNPGRTREPRGAVGAPGVNDLVLDRYRLLECLGSGGFGVVWRARDELLHREVAVKRIPLGPDGDGERAGREALASARLAHPAIVSLYEACDVQDAFYLISELVHGRTLAELIAARSLSDDEVLDIGVALACALSHAHARGVIHRDVKPQNVLIPDERDERAPSQEGFLGAAKLTDFGGASLAGEDALTRTGDVLGTLAYMAPEQSEGRQVGGQADLYALALVLYEALCGVNPVRGSTPAATARRIGSRLPPLEGRRADLPRELTRAIDTALAPSPSARGTLDGLRLALEQTRELEAGPTRRPRRRADAAGLSRDEAPETIPEPAEVAPPFPARPPGAEAVPGAVEAAQAGSPDRGEPGRQGLPRSLWLTCALAAVVWQVVSGSPGAALLLLAAGGPLLLLPRRCGPSWLGGALAPVLGLAGLAGAFPAIAGQAAWWRKRATLGALGYWWLMLAGPLFARDLWLAAPAGTPAHAVWEGSVSSAAAHVLAPMLSLGALLGAILWALAAVVLPWIVRGRSAAFDVVGATVWSAALASAARMLDSGLAATGAHPMPRSAILGAILGGVFAVGARALRGPV